MISSVNRLEINIKKLLFPSLLLVIFLLLPPVQFAKAQTALLMNERALLMNGPASVADLVEELVGAVVNISISQSIENSAQGEFLEKPLENQPFQEFFDDFFQDNGHRRSSPFKHVNSLGSGFVIDGKGIIVTNNHVIENADNIDVIFSNGNRLAAKLIGSDPETDIALLKVEAKEDLDFVSFGDSTKMRRGDWVMAIGNPFGLGGSVSIGIVSAIGRDINSGPFDNFIQTDTAINRGNSGGPLFNMKGEVIGINTAIFSPSGGSIGIGFSVPSELALNVINQLREFGETRRGWLGIRIQPVTDDIAQSLDMGKARGALVAGIIPSGPVDGKMQLGDIIINFNGRDITALRNLPQIVAESPIGQEIWVTVLRNGKVKKIKVTLTSAKNNEKNEEEIETFDDEHSGIIEKEPRKLIELMGMELNELTNALRDEFNIDDKIEGVLINAVDEGSAALQKNIKAGDVMIEVAQEVVKTPKDVKKIIERLKADGRRNAFFMIADPSGNIRFVTLRLSF